MSEVVEIPIVFDTGKQFWTLDINKCPEISSPNYWFSESYKHSFGDLDKTFDIKKNLITQKTVEVQSLKSKLFCQ